MDENRRRCAASRIANLVLLAFAMSTRLIRRPSEADSTVDSFPMCNVQRGEGVLRALCLQCVRCVGESITNGKGSRDEEIEQLQGCARGGYAENHAQAQASQQEGFSCEYY